jgi:hypothetical protein
MDKKYYVVPRYSEDSYVTILHTSSKQGGYYANRVY